MVGGKGKIEVRREVGKVVKREEGDGRRKREVEEGGGKEDGKGEGEDGRWKKKLTMHDSGMYLYLYRCCPAWI